MGRNDISGEIPSIANGEWQEIERALPVAIEMALLTRDGLDSIRQIQIQQHVIRERDPRLAVSLSMQQSRIMLLLTSQFKLNMPDPSAVISLCDTYHRIYQRLIVLEQNSFRMVSHSVANKGGGVAGGDTFGYVIPGQNLIYLNETYFSLQKQSQISSSANTEISGAGTGNRQVRGTVTINPDEMRIVHSLERRASIILHETVHICCGAAGAIHRAIRGGDRIDTETINCNVGFSQIANYNVASGDAYVYERFARCVYQSRGSN